jgi:hypothetical protein
MKNERDIDLELLMRFVAKNKLKFHDGLIRRYFGEILLNIGGQHLSEAENLINEAIGCDKQNGMMFHLGNDHALYAKLLKRKNDIPKAKNNLGKAIEIFKECGADGWVEKYEKELAEL